MSEKNSNKISGLVSVIGDRLDELRDLANYMDDYHKPFSKSVSKIKQELDNLYDKMIEIKNDLREYLKNEGCEDYPAYTIIGTFSSGISGHINTPDDGDIPHIHITHGTDKFCVEFQNPKYYDHDIELSNTLTDENKEELMEFFRSPLQHRKFDSAGITIWDYALLTWNLNHPYKKVPDDIEMPDYMLL